MEDREKAPLAIRIFAPLVFLFGSIAALFWFFYRLAVLFSGTQSEIVVFDKGSFYMLGVGIGVSVAAFTTVQEGWLGRLLSKKQSTLLTRLAVVSVASLFVAPNLIHYVANGYFSDRGYTVCEEASHQWLFVRDIVYIEQSVECSVNLKEK